MTIKIVLPKLKEGNEVKTGIGTKVFNDKGDKVTNVTSVDIHVSGDSIITATMDIAVDSIDEMDNIHALLGTETLEHIAALHGKTLYDVKSEALAVDMKFDASGLEPVERVLELLCKYADELPEQMQEDLKALI